MCQYMNMFGFNWENDVTEELQLTSIFPLNPVMNEAATSASPLRSLQMKES